MISEKNSQTLFTRDESQHEDEGHRPLPFWNVPKMFFGYHGIFEKGWLPSDERTQSVPHHLTTHTNVL